MTFWGVVFAGIALRGDTGACTLQLVPPEPLKRYSWGVLVYFRDHGR